MAQEASVYDTIVKKNHSFMCIYGELKVIYAYNLPYLCKFMAKEVRDKVLSPKHYVVQPHTIGLLSECPREAKRLDIP